MKINFSILMIIACAMVYGNTSTADIRIDTGHSFPNLEGFLNLQTKCQVEHSKKDGGEQISIIAGYEKEKYLSIFLFTKKSGALINNGQVKISVGKIDVTHFDAVAELGMFGIIGGDGGIQYFPLTDGSECHLDAKIVGGKILEGLVSCAGLTTPQDPGTVVSPVAQKFQCEIVEK